MPLQQDARSVWGTGFLLSKIHIDKDELKEGLKIVGSQLPIPTPQPAPIAEIEVDLDNDGDPDVRVTIDDIEEDDDE